MKTQLVVALDYSQPSQAEALIEQLNGLPVIYKVGLELYLSADGAWVKKLTALGHRIFLDLKFYDIPNTVGAAVVKAADLGAEFVTLHLSGGSRMLDEVETRLQEALLKKEISKRPQILGVSVLTSFREEDWIANVSHFAKVSGVRSIKDAVLHFAHLASEHPAVQGVVCSPEEIAIVREKYPALFLMVPGIRLAGGPSHDQSRVMTPGDAARAGASAIVVGRPITQAKNPREITEIILKDIS